MIFPLCKWHFDINWHKFEKRWAVVFQIYPNAIHLNPLQFCPSMPLLGFPVLSLSSSKVSNRYFHILVNSMTFWSVLKLPKIAWPSPFKTWPEIYWSTYITGFLPFTNSVQKKILSNRYFEHVEERGTEKWFEMEGGFERACDKSERLPERHIDGKMIWVLDNEEVMITR